MAAPRKKSEPSALTWMDVRPDEYDALLAETHDTTVSCLTEVEVTAVPQDELRLASNRDASGYLGETMKAQHDKGESLKSKLVESGQEAQILPMMAKAAVAGGGVEYDK